MVRVASWASRRTLDARRDVQGRCPGQSAERDVEPAVRRHATCSPSRTSTVVVADSNSAGPSCPRPGSAHRAGRRGRRSIRRDRRRRCRGVGRVDVAPHRGRLRAVASVNQLADHGDARVDDDDFLPRRAVGVQLFVALVEARRDLVEEIGRAEVDASRSTPISKICSPYRMSRPRRTRTGPSNAPRRLRPSRSSVAKSRRSAGGLAAARARSRASARARSAGRSRACPTRRARMPRSGRRRGGSRAAAPPV